MVERQTPLRRRRGEIYFVFQGNVHGGENEFNTKLVNPKEIKSYGIFWIPSGRARSLPTMLTG
jgi:hypothetical protein